MPFAAKTIRGINRQQQPKHIPLQGRLPSVLKHEAMAEEETNARFRELEEQFAIFMLEQKEQSEKLRLEQQKEFERKLEISRLEQQKEFEKKLEISRLEQQKEFEKKLEGSRLEFEEKSTFQYWDTLDELWEFQRAKYKGLYNASFRYRQYDRAPQIYRDVQVLLTNGTDVEAVLQENSVFSLTMQTESIVTMDTNENPGTPLVDDGNRATRESMERTHLKTFLGETKGETQEISKAHAFPKDKDCNLYWWPMLRIVTGIDSTDLNRSALDKVAAMKTNKIVFPGPHNHIYDDLKKGVVCTIPIFGSMEEMATEWRYGEGYEMLIVCDSAKTYRALQIMDDRSFPHITVASPKDVADATSLVAEMMKVMADSLVSNWDSHYNDLDEVGGRKKMLKDMKDILSEDNEEVHIPVIKKPTEDIKLYKIDYGILYRGNAVGQKYIHDPFPALIKSAINLSAFFNKRHQHGPERQRCKLLPACSCLQDHDDSENSSVTDILDLLENAGYDLRNSRPASEFPSLIGYRSHETSSAVVSVDELEREQYQNHDADDDDDAKSVISDLTSEQWHNKHPSTRGREWDNVPYDLMALTIDIRGE